MSTSAREVPYEFNAAWQNQNWRSSLSWPRSVDQAEYDFDGAAQGILKFIARLDDQSNRDIVLLANALVFGRCLSLIDVAACHLAAEKKGLILNGVAPTLEYLRGETTDVTAASVFLSDRPQVLCGRWPQLSRWRSSTRWNRLSKMGSALWHPEIEILTVNELLQDVLLDRNSSVLYQDPGQLLTKARENPDLSQSTTAYVELSSSMAMALMESLDIEEPWRSRLNTLLKVHCLKALKYAAEDLAALKSVRRMPEVIWSGSAGNYAVRAIGIEVIRRGGSAVRFDHTGTFSFCFSPKNLALIELGVSSHFVGITPKLANNMITSGARELVPFRSIEITSHRGDRGLLRLPLVQQNTARDKRRVLYVSTCVKGFGGHHLYMAIAPIVYLDWQLRLASYLRSLNVDLLCKPHPQGVFRNALKQPIEDVAPTSYQAFEEVMGWATVFVFDRLNTTTFWEAVCTDRPIIYIKIGPPEFHPDVREVMERRLITLQAYFDENNLPQLDLGELKSAIMSCPARVDAHGVQKLLIGRTVE